MRKMLRGTFLTGEKHWPGMLCYHEHIAQPLWTFLFVNMPSESTGFDKAL